MRNLHGILTLLLTVLVFIAIALATRIFSEKVEYEMYPDDYSVYVKKYSQEYGIDEYLIHSIIWVESTCRADAVSKTGARGLMQITDGTLPDINVMLDEQYSFDDMFDPETNIRCGVCYLDYLYERFGDTQLVIAAYNGGPTNVSGWLKDSRYSDGKSLTHIPIEVTARYVNKVNSCYEKYAELYKGT